VWGKNDPFFIPAGAEAYKNDVPDASTRLLDTGHFALEEEADTIAEHINELMNKAFGYPPPAPSKQTRAEADDG